MGFSFRKSIKLGKNSQANVSKSGVSLSTGVKGARVNLSKNGIKLYGGKGPIRYQKFFSFKKIIDFLTSLFTKSGN